MSKKFPVKDINIPQSNLPRVITGTKSRIVESYAEQMADGIIFPPIKVWKNGGRQWLVWDGVHRLSAAKAAGAETIDCEVYEFPENEFLLRAFSANLKHGLPLKHQEKVDVTRALYQKEYTVKEIAEKTAIPERTLQRWIKNLADEKKQERDEKIKQLHEQGYTQEQIAEQADMTQQSVSSILQKTANCLFFAMPE
ncbi:MAG: ParB N-terminal domain-containing protein, partial [Desulfosarcina sp.]|nr:ParB N-terminal domain-containing protein [Desulfobacterales bacterium]